MSEDGEKPLIVRSLRNQNRGRTQATVEALASIDLKDQFYTKVEVMHTIVDAISGIVSGAKEATYVDYSCGTNDFARILKARGLFSNFISYDLAPTVEALADGAIRQNWFSVKALPQNTTVGINPPFGCTTDANFNGLQVQRQYCSPIP